MMFWRIVAFWLAMVGGVEAATITQQIDCKASLIGPKPSDAEFTMHVGDVVHFVPLNDGCYLYYAPPSGFTQNAYSGGWSFTATAENVKYPYAYFMFAGVEGRFTTYSVVVYNP